MLISRNYLVRVRGCLTVGIVVVVDDDFFVQFELLSKTSEFELLSKESEFERTRNIWYLSVDKGLVRVMIEKYLGSFP